MKRGFTIIELLIVVTVISILVGITLMSFTAYQNKAWDSQAGSLTSTLRAGLERYYNLNNEYPLATALYGGSISGSCATPASYTTASSILEVQTNILGGDANKLSMCASNVNLSSGDKTKVYYISKPTATDVTAYTLTIGSCTFTIPTTDVGNMSYILVYYKRQNTNWRVFKSNHGNVQTSDGTLCPFLSDV